jgi:hypothetical protein
MGINDKIRKKLIKFLRIHEWNDYGFDVNRLLSFEANAAKNTIWYNGDSYELSQLFSQIPNDNKCFWGAHETAGLEIRKMHTGLPKMLVNTLTNVTCSDLNDFEFKEDADAELWDRIADENSFNKLVKKSTNNVLKIGDGAFKISFNSDISELPIIEFYSGENVEFIYNKGRVKEIKFFTKYNKKEAKYTLEETYGYGYIYYKLYKDDKEVGLDAIGETMGIENVIFDNKKILAVPYMIFESETYPGRGQSIFDGKNDAFDALDEVVSQWLDAIRSGRVKTYIPSSLIPRDMSTGAMLKPNAFDNKFIKIADSMSEGSDNKIVTEQPQIQVAAYESTYITNLDLALQGLISPSTIGIDVKKLDNAESQREKEKTTLYTRQIIIDTLSIVLKKLIQITFDAYNIQYQHPTKEIEVEVGFGEYANPSFEAVIETMSNPNTPMSIEAKVEEIWGDSKTKEWKEEEVLRIKAEQGILSVDEPSFSTDYTGENEVDYNIE